MVTDAEQMMDAFYQDWWSDQSKETVCIPASLDVNKNAFLGPTDPQAANYDASSFNDKKRFHKGQTAEDTFLRAFEKLNLGGVLVSGFDSAEYPAFQKMNKKKLREKLGIKDIEIDAIFIHRSIGIFVIEIKATKKSTAASNIFDSPGYQKAEIQLNKFQKQVPLIFQRICNSAQCEVPIYFAICFPFAFLNRRKNNVFVHIDQSCFLDEEKLKKIFVSRMNLGPENAEHIKQLKKFACAIAGYRSIEFSSAGCNALVIHKMIDSQSFGGGQKIAGSDIFWTNEQLAILECNDRHQLIFGPPGTGKTLILMQKALYAARQGKKVYVIAPATALRCRFQMFFDNIDKDHAILHKLIVDDLGALREDISLEPEDYVFLDEVTFTEEIMKTFQTAGCNVVIVATGSMNPFQIVKNIQMLISQCELMDVRYFTLNTVVRSSLTIFDEWKTNFTNVPIRIGHNCRGPTIKRYKAINSDQILHNVFHIIEELQRQIGPDLYSNLAVIVNHNEDIVQRFLSSKGVPCGTAIEQMKTQGIAAICSFEDSLSLEWPFVIVSSVISLDLWITFQLISTSRCISQLYIIERDYMSVQAIIDKKFCELRDRNQTVDSATFAGIVVNSGKEVNETRKNILYYDTLFAHIRHNFVKDETSQSIEEFRDYSTLFDCLVKITRSTKLCEWLLTYENLKLGRTRYRSVTDGPTKLFTTLLSNRSKHEIVTYWKIVEALRRKLILVAEMQANQEITAERLDTDCMNVHRLFFADVICILII